MWKKITQYNQDQIPQWIQVSSPHLPEGCTDLDNDFNQQEGGHLYCPHAEHSYSGWKTHIFSTTPEEVSAGLEIAHPIIAKHGLGCKFANDAMLDTLKRPEHQHQYGKGITIYHPDIRSGKHLDEMNELTDALKAGNHPAMGKITGDTMISPHAGVRYELTRNFYDDQTGKLRNVNASEYQRHYSPNYEEEEAPEIREALFHARKRSQRSANKECTTDEWGFHIDPDTGRRTTKRYGIDAYAHRCQKCGVVGYIDGSREKGDWGFHVDDHRTQEAQDKDPV